MKRKFSANLRSVYLIYEKIVRKRLVLKSVLTINVIYKQRDTNQTDREKTME